MRLKSTDVWHNAPGIICAYQPVDAPDPLLARYNVGSNGSMAGRNTAKPGVLPSWRGATGWTFNGTTQYLTTGIIPGINSTAIVRFTGASISALAVPFGLASTGAGTLAIVPNYAFGSYWDNGAGEKKVLIVYTSGVLGVAGSSGYANGASVVSGLGAWTTANTRDIYLGALNNNDTAGLFFPGAIQSFVVAAFPLSPAHVWQYSRQMAYCEVNPDWSAWGRRRQYFYAPAQAGFVAAWARNANTVIQANR